VLLRRAGVSRLSKAAYEREAQTILREAAERSRAEELDERRLPAGEVREVEAARRTFERLGYDVGTDPLGG
jgi:hypothetical protein